MHSNKEVVRTGWWVSSSVGRLQHWSSGSSALWWGLSAFPRWGTRGLVIGALSPSSEHHAGTECPGCAAFLIACVCELPPAGDSASGRQGQDSPVFCVASPDSGCVTHALLCLHITQTRLQPPLAKGGRTESLRVTLASGTPGSWAGWVSLQPQLCFSRVGSSFGRLFPRAVTDGHQQFWRGLQGSQGQRRQQLRADVPGKILSGPAWGICPPL